MLIKAGRLATSPIPQIVEGIFPVNGTGWAHGESGCGKSFLIIKLALDMANGVNWFGRKTIQGDVVYAIGEGAGDLGIRIKAQIAYHHQQIASQAAAIAERYGPDAAAEFMDAQPPYTDERLFIETDAFPMPFGMDKKPSTGMLQFIASIDARRIAPTRLDPAMVIFDAMNDFADTRSTQNLASATRYTTGHKYLAEQLGCFVLGIGHDTQDGKKMSGNLRFFESCDISFSIKKEKNGDKSSDRVSVVSSEKAKPGGSFEFDSWSYQALEQIWDEPLWDEDDPDLPIVDEETGLQKTEEVRTYVVIPRVDPENSDTDASADPVDDGWDTPIATQDLPELRTPIPSRRTRNGIKPERHGTSGVGKITLGILSVPCPEEGCNAPAGKSCNPAIEGALHLGPGTDIHPSRADAAVEAGTITPERLIQAQVLAARSNLTNA